MPRYKIRSGNFDITYDDAYMTVVEEQSTVSYVDTQADCLYVFVDEMGDENLPRGEGFFGLNGCAFLGTIDKDGLNGGWLELRKKLFKVPDDKPFHATRHFSKLKAKDYKTLSSFFVNYNVMYASSFIRTTAPVAQRADIVDAVLGQLEDCVNSLFSAQVRRDEWYFEHSYRLSPKLMMSIRNPSYYRAAQHGGISFIQKSSLIPAVELADLVSFIVGDALRREGIRKIPHAELLDTLFLGGQRGRCSEVISTFRAHIPAPTKEGEH